MCQHLFCYWKVFKIWAMWPGELMNKSLHGCAQTIPLQAKWVNTLFSKTSKAMCCFCFTARQKQGFGGEGFPWSPKNDLKLNKNTGLVCTLLRHSVLIYREGCWLSPPNVKNTRYLCQIHFVLHILTSPNPTGLLRISVSAAQYAPI